MKKHIPSKPLCAVFLACILSCINPQGTIPITEHINDSPCDGCDLMLYNMPDSITDTCIIEHDFANPQELHISGKIISPPSYSTEDLIIYIYHTDPEGLYRGGETRHGALRGWVRPDGDGKYNIKTIVPGAYPGRNDPSHIHFILKEKNKSPYWIDDICFDHDPLYTGEKKNNRSQRGGSGTTRIDTTQSIWNGSRNIYIGQNIPGHPLEKHYSAPCLTILPGEDMISFPIQYIIGPDKGKHACPICSYKNADPGILIYIQKKTQYSVIHRVVELAEKLQIRNPGTKTTFIIQENSENTINKIKTAFETINNKGDIKSSVGTIPNDPSHLFSRYGLDYENSFVIEYREGKASELYCDLEEAMSIFN